MQFKIVLNYSSPRIWRRILVPKECTFFALHCAIQDAMGWTDTHLQWFCFDRRGQSKPVDRRIDDLTYIEYPNPEIDYSDRESLDETKEHVADWLPIIAKQCIYEYDFGDSWQHTVLFERAVFVEEGTLPRCVAGKGACPPEDCGGIGGYIDLQHILKDPKDPEHADMMDWLGFDDPSEFRPLDFDPMDVEFTDPEKRLKSYREGFGR